MAPNKYLQLLDQGLSAFVFEKEEGKPILRDNPLLVAPWRDELEDYLCDLDPNHSLLWTAGIILDSRDGIIFSSYEQATDYNSGFMPRSGTFSSPAPLIYVRSAEVAAC